MGSTARERFRSAAPRTSETVRTPIVAVIKCSHFKTEADVGATCISKCAFARRPGKNRQCPDLAAFIEANEAECSAILAKITASKPFKEAFPFPTAEGIAAARAGTAIKVAAVTPASSPSGCSPYVAKPEDIEDGKEEKFDVPLVPIRPEVFPTLKPEAAAELVRPPVLKISELETIVPCPPKQVLATMPAEHTQPKKREKAIKNSFVIFVETAPGSGLFTMNDIDIRDLVTYTMAGRRVIAAPEASEF